MSSAKRHKTPTKGTGTTTSRRDVAKQAVLEKCCSEIDEAMKENDGRKPYGIVADMVKDLKHVCPWITRHVINFAYEKHTGRWITRAKEPMVVKEKEQPTETPKPNVRGRSIRTTNEAKHEMKVRKQKCLEAASLQYDYEMKTAKQRGRYIRRGTLARIIREQKEKFNIPDAIKIDREAIRSRYYRGNLFAKNVGPESPMSDVEPKLVELIIRMGRIRRCLTPSQCLLLANDLIEGTAYESKVIDFKEIRLKKKLQKASLGKKYWQGFKKDGNTCLPSKGGKSLPLIELLL